MPAGFLTPLRLEKVGPQRWSVLTDLVFHSAELRATYVVPAGFSTDLASIPGFAQWAISKVGRHDEPATLHDCAYAGELLVEDVTGSRHPVRLIKPLADRLFREALVTCGVSSRTATAMYWAVSLFGRKGQQP